MSRNTSQFVPSYRRHKSTGQAVVTLAGRDFYLGKWNTDISRREYDRLIAEWISNGRRLPTAAGEDLTVTEMAAAYWRFAQAYYRKDGRPSGQIPGIKIALRFLRRQYGHTLAKSFGPLSLKALQEHMVELGQSRPYVNDNCARIKRVFKWAVANELIPVAIFQALLTVPGLKKGRTVAREPEPIKPVADEVIETTIGFLPPVVAAMVKFQKLTGCRPGEVCILRPCDVDRSSGVWSFRPRSHKSEHHDRERVVFIGPKAQGILLPFLNRSPEEYCFSPAESERVRKAVLRSARKSKVQPSQLDRSKSNPSRCPAERYSPSSYRRAIERASDAADRQFHVNDPSVPVGQRAVPRWSPNQIRHTAATDIRHRFGLEAVQVVLGHSKADVSQIYAERDLTLAAKIMAEVG